MKVYYENNLTFWDERFELVDNMIQGSITNKLNKPGTGQIKIVDFTNEDVEWWQDHRDSGTVFWFYETHSIYQFFKGKCTISHVVSVDQYLVISFISVMAELTTKFLEHLPIVTKTVYADPVASTNILDLTPVATWADGGYANGDVIKILPREYDDVAWHILKGKSVCTFLYPGIVIPKKAFYSCIGYRRWSLDSFVNIKDMKNSLYRFINMPIDPAATITNIRFLFTGKRDDVRLLTEDFADPFDIEVKIGALPYYDIPTTWIPAQRPTSYAVTGVPNVSVTPEKFKRHATITQMELTFSNKPAIIAALNALLVHVDYTARSNRIWFEFNPINGTFPAVFKKMNSVRGNIAIVIEYNDKGWLGEVPFICYNNVGNTVYLNNPDVQLYESGIRKGQKTLVSKPFDTMVETELVGIFTNIDALDIDEFNFGIFEIPDNYSFMQVFTDARNQSLAIEYMSQRDVDRSDFNNAIPATYLDEIGTIWTRTDKVLPILETMYDICYSKSSYVGTAPAPTAFPPMHYQSPNVTGDLADVSMYVKLDSNLASVEVPYFFLQVPYYDSGYKYVTCQFWFKAGQVEVDVDGTPTVYNMAFVEDAINHIWFSIEGLFVNQQLVCSIPDEMYVTAIGERIKIGMDADAYTTTNPEFEMWISHFVRENHDPAYGFLPKSLAQTRMNFFMKPTGRYSATQPVSNIPTDTLSVKNLPEETVTIDMGIILHVDKEDLRYSGVRVTINGSDNSSGYAHIPGPEEKSITKTIPTLSTNRECEQYAKVIAYEKVYHNFAFEIQIDVGYSFLYEVGQVVRLEVDNFKTDLPYYILEKNYTCSDAMSHTVKLKIGLAHSIKKIDSFANNINLMKEDIRMIMNYIAMTRRSKTFGLPDNQHSTQAKMKGDHYMSGNLNDIKQPCLIAHSSSPTFSGSNWLVAAATIKDIHLITLLNQYITLPGDANDGDCYWIVTANASWSSSLSGNYIDLRVDNTTVNDYYRGNDARNFQHVTALITKSDVNNFNISVGNTGTCTYISVKIIRGPVIGSRD